MTDRGWKDADEGKTPDSDVMAHAMGWSRPVLRSDKSRARAFEAIDAGLHEARGTPKPRGRRR
jgi:hypothetical protein